MATLVSIDANVIVALVDARDTWHAKATALRDALILNGAHLVYFDCALAEAISVIARRAEEQNRSDQFVHLLDGLLATVSEQSITWTSILAQRLFRQVLDVCRTHQGRLNYNDALMALSCRELGIRRIASFDTDFDALESPRRIASPVCVADLLEQSPDE